jgi:hypothetical protein
MPEQPPEQTPEDYAREKLVEDLVERGIQRGLAKRHVEERITQFEHVTSNGRQLVMVKLDGRLWPTFNAGDTNPHAMRLAEELYADLDSPYERRVKGVKGEVQSAL